MLKNVGRVNSIACNRVLITGLCSFSTFHEGKEKQMRSARAKTLSCSLKIELPPSSFSIDLWASPLNRTELSKGLPLYEMTTHCCRLSKYIN